MWDTYKRLFTNRIVEKYVEHLVRSIFVDKQKDQPKKMLSLNR